MALALPQAGGRPPLPRRLVVFASVLAVAGGLVVVVAARSLGPSDVGAQPGLFWLLAGLYVVAELVPVPLLSERGGATFTASWVFILALMLVTPGLIAAVLVPVVVLLVTLLQRGRPLMAAYNGGQFALCVVAGLGVLELGGQRTALLDGQPGLLFVPWVIACAAVLLALSWVLYQTGESLEHNERVLPGLLSIDLSAAAVDAALVPLAPILVVVGQRSLTLLPLLLVTAAVVYRSAWIAVLRHHEAGHDTLTGLANRRSFSAQAIQTLELANGTPVALAILDLDGFKTINDRLGHQIGDEVLRALAGRLRQRLRPTDLVARLGGDEFAFLLHIPGGLAEAEELVGRILEAVREPVTVGGFPLTVGGSVGVAYSPDHGTELETLTRHADLAMYRAKRGDGGMVVHSRDAGEAEVGRLSLLADLPNAIATRQLFVEYQPVIDVASGRVSGAEGLVRWQHPQLGLVPPGAFVPLAEHTDLIGDLTELVLGDAIAQCAAWRAAGLDLGVAVNISARNLADRRFPRLVARLLESAGVPATMLTVEITESAVMADPERSAAVLAELRGHGVQAAIDDFGTGYSSLSRLRRLAVQGLKIDRSFVRDLGDGDVIMVRSILELARSLGLRTVAEGVEDPAAYTVLADLGCDQVQGYLFSRPVSGDEVAALASRSFLPVRLVAASA